MPSTRVVTTAALVGAARGWRPAGAPVLHRPGGAGRPPPTLRRHTAQSSASANNNNEGSFSANVGADGIISTRFQDEVGWVDPGDWVFDAAALTSSGLPELSEMPSSLASPPTGLRRGAEHHQLLGSSDDDDDDDAELAAPHTTTTPGGESPRLIELPLVVVDAPLLPCGTHAMPASDERLKQLYDEILLSGSRRFVVALGERPSKGAASEDEPTTTTTWGFPEDESIAPVVVEEPRSRRRASSSFSDDEPPRVAEIGCVLYVTDVADDRATGLRTYEHAVQPVRVRIHRIIERPEGRLYARVGVAVDREEDATSEPLGLAPSLPVDSSSRKTRRRSAAGAAEDDDEPGTTPGALLAGLLSRLDSLVHDAFALVPGDLLVGAEHHHKNRNHRNDGDDDDASARVGGAHTQASSSSSSKRGPALRSAATIDALLRRRRRRLRLTRHRQSAEDDDEPSPLSRGTLDERRVMSELVEIARLQKRLDEDVCFREEAVMALGAGPGAGVGSLWHLANACWLLYLKARATTRARRVYSDIHDRLVDFLRDSGRLPPGSSGSSPGPPPSGPQHSMPEQLALSITELPAPLQRDLLRLKQRVSDEIEPIVAQHKAAQTLLHADTHAARCVAFHKLLSAERRRLAARAVLRDALESEALPFAASQHGLSSSSSSEESPNGTSS